MRIYTFIYVIFFFVCRSYAQIVPLDSFKTNAQEIFVDDLGYIYTVQGQTLSRHTKDTVLYRYSTVGMGDIHTVDVSDPFKIKVLYTDYGLVLTLNNTLNEIEQTTLSTINYQGITAIAKSNGNALWVYSTYTNNLIKINEKGRPIREGTTLYEAPHIHFMTQKDEYLFAIDSTQGIFIFDLYGDLQNQINLHGVKKIHYYRNYLYFLHQGYLCRAHIPSLKIEKTIPLPSYNDIAIRKNHLYGLRDGYIDVLDLSASYLE